MIIDNSDANVGIKIISANNFDKNLTKNDKMLKQG